MVARPRPADLWQQRGRLALAAACIIVVLVTLVGNARPFVSRTAVVNAETTALRVTFDESGHWLVEGGIDLCLPNPDLRAALRQSHPVCNQFLHGGNFRRLSLAAGDQMEVRLEPGGDLLLRFPACEGADCPAPAAAVGGGADIRPRDHPNGFALIPAQALRAAGPMAVSGRITLGRNLGVGGSSDFLLGGSYEIRETTLLTRLFGRRSVAIERGELIPGAEVTLLAGKEPSAHSKGHFFLASQDGQPILRAVALSSTGNGALRMEVKGAEAIQIDPDWIDSVIASPISLALAFLMGLLLNALQLIAPLVGKETSAMPPRPPRPSRPRQRGNGREKRARRRAWR